MRHGTAWTSVALLAMASGACAHARPAPMSGGYPARDRHALVLLFPVGSQCKVVAGPETHIGFPGRKVIWRVVNLCGRSAQLEFHIYKRVPENAPDPFVDGGEFAPRVESGFGKENMFERMVKKASDFGHGEQQYFYWIGLKGDADSRMEPELDIWP